MPILGATYKDSEGILMNDTDGMIVDITLFPSPNPHIMLYTVTYLADGLKVKGLLAVPDKMETEDGFLYLRGGIKNVGQVRPGRIVQFAAEGFVVFAPYYRGNRGGEGREDFAGDDRHDAYAAVRVLKRYVKNIHVFGFSRGGIMAIWTAIEFPEIASLVTWGGVSDMLMTYEERVDLRRMMKRVIGGTPNKFRERYEERTPVEELKALQCPVLIIHGVRDENVQVTQAEVLQERLTAFGKRVESWYFNEYTHYFPPAVNRRTVKNLSLWMKDQVKR